MSDPVESQSLQGKLLALQKQVLELEQKYNSLLETIKQPTTIPKIITPEEVDATKTPDVPIDNAKIDKKETSEPASRVKIVLKTKDPDTHETVEQLEKSPILKEENSDTYAFILKKTTNEKFSNEEDTSEIDILNLNLWDLLKEHLSDYPYHLFRGSPVTLYSPYEAIIFKWDILSKASAQPQKNEKDDKARKDLKLLLDTLSGGSSGDAQLDKYFKSRLVYPDQDKIQYTDLWTIFPPGTLIYGNPFQKEDQLFIVQDNVATWPELDERPQKQLPWKLSAWTYDWTGEIFQRTPFMLVFEPFEGYRPITALPYYPFELHPDHNAVKNKLVERGKSFRALCIAKVGSRLFDYTGEAIFRKKGFSGLLQSDDDDGDLRSRHPWSDFRRIFRHESFEFNPATAKSSHVNGRVMVDYLSYFQYGSSIAQNGALERSSMSPDCMCSDCQDNIGLVSKYRTHFDKLEAQQKPDWNCEQYMLCPPRVLGYVLGDKQWAQLQVTLVNEISGDGEDNAWKSRLNLAEKNTKELLLKLVRSHISSSQPSETRLEVDDIIPGKGKGLVVLLYGPPGVGKTSTAETIAVETRKPLFSISVADVGTKASHVESNLSRIFSLATSWQAILLIDEADVFLESRGTSSSTSTTEKNAIVSVFLRVLEYYQGIIFLTTNQIAQFDIAIPSRIHVAIQYDILKPHQMEAIFKGFLDPLEKDGLIDKYNDILEYLKEDVYVNGLDGRKIRNIVTTALGLARAEHSSGQGKPKLEKKHLKAVVSNAFAFKKEFALQFDRYMNKQRMEN